jgi:hypothetical protein
MITDNVRRLEIELLKSAYQEASELKEKAFHAAEAAILAESPLHAGDRFTTKERHSVSKYNNYYGSKRPEEKIYEVKDVWVEGESLDLRANAYPIKKNGKVSVIDKFSLRDIEHVIASGKIRIVTNDAN